MADRVASHYSENLDLAGVIAKHLRSAGKDFQHGNHDRPRDRRRVPYTRPKSDIGIGRENEFHAESNVLDIGSGLGGPARTLAETYGCRVTGIDLTQAFCDAAAAMSDWVGLGKRVSFQQGDATNLPLANNEFDAVMTIHVAMNIGAKDKMYMEAHRVIKPNGIFAVYDVLQGEVAKVLYPVPWAREPSIDGSERSAIFALHERSTKLLQRTWSGTGTSRT